MGRRVVALQSIFNNFLSFLLLMGTELLLLEDFQLIKVKRVSMEFLAGPPHLTTLAQYLE